MIKEFIEFLKKYNVIALAVAFIIGISLTTLIKSLVDNIIMPIITPFIPGGAWQTATASIGPIVLGLGAFAGAVINFLIIAFTAFLIVKLLIKESKK